MFVVERKNSSGAFSSHVCKTVADIEEYLTTRSFRGDAIRIKELGVDTLTVRYRAVWKPVPRFGYQWSVFVYSR